MKNIENIKKIPAESAKNDKKKVKPQKKEDIDDYIFGKENILRHSER